ncbi:hypothetical protein P5F04_15730 [Clostridium perfringens]|nr:hypothetical protein [Clostridium perfringens]
MNVIALKSKEQIKKFTIVDTEHLIDTLKDIMPISKDIAILNIRKYGFIKEEDYILESLGFSISNNKKIKIRKDIEIQAKLFSILFDIDKNCFIRLRNKETGQIRAYNVQALQDPYRLQAILKSKHFDNLNDMMYSLNCYNNMYTCTEDTLFSLQNFALDIDFDTNKYSLKEVINKIKSMYKSNELLTPNIIEYGHRIRLIYSIQDVAVKKGSKKAINLINKVAKAINRKLPIELNSSVQALTTYGRIIGSVNTKNNSEIKVEIINPNKYILRDLQNSLLEQPEWLVKVKKANSKVVGIQNPYSLNLARLADFEKIQKIRQTGYREILCYLYRNYCLLSNLGQEETWEKLKEFNQKFSEPLRENCLDGDTKHLNRKQYLHKSSTILELLDITPNEEIGLNLDVILSDTEYKRRENVRGKKNYEKKLKEQGKLTKKEQLEIIYGKIKSLLREGFTQKNIAIELDIKLPTLKRYIKHIKDNGL